MMSTGSDAGRFGALPQKRKTYKSDLRLRWFESITHHHFFTIVKPVLNCVFISKVILRGIAVLHNKDKAFQAGLRPFRAVAREPKFLFLTKTSSLPDHLHPFCEIE